MWQSQRGSHSVKLRHALKGFGRSVWKPKDILLLVLIPAFLYLAREHALSRGQDLVAETSLTSLETSRTGETSSHFGDVVPVEQHGAANIQLGSSAEKTIPVTAEKAFPVTADQVTSHESTVNEVTTRWARPPPLSDIYHYKRGSDISTRVSNYSYFRPRVLFSYARPVLNPASHYELFVYTSGITIGTLNRNFTVRGCMLGTDVYPSTWAIFDIVKCVVPRKVQAGERISVTLAKDETLRKAMRGPVELGKGVTAKLEDGDVIEVPASTKLRLDDDTKHEDLMQIRTEEFAHGIDSTPKEKMNESPRYEICAATQMKMYPHLLKDWTDYHRRIGVDMVYIMDNNGPTDFAELFKGRSDVEVVFWPFLRSQIQSFSYFTHWSRSRCEWMFLFDGDEYLMLGLGKNGELASKKPLKRYLDRLQPQRYDLLEFRFVIMGSGGLIEIPKVAPPEAYIYQDDRDDSRHGKTILRTDLDWVYHGLHWVRRDEGVHTSGHRTPTEVNKYPKEETDDPSLVHYRYRSFEESKLKMGTESANFGNTRAPGAAKDISKLTAGPYYSKRLDESMKYTHFRNIWRQVTAEAGLGHQTLVRTEGGKRCTVSCKIVGSSSECGEEKCGTAL